VTFRSNAIAIASSTVMMRAASAMFGVAAPNIMTNIAGSTHTEPAAPGVDPVINLISIPILQSARSATSGSTCIARRAGRFHPPLQTSAC